MLFSVVSAPLVNADVVEAAVRHAYGAHEGPLVDLRAEQATLSLMLRGDLPAELHWSHFADGHHALLAVVIESFLEVGARMTARRVVYVCTTTARCDAKRLRPYVAVLMRRPGDTRAVARVIDLARRRRIVRDLERRVQRIRAGAVQRAFDWDGVADGGVACVDG